LFIRNVPTDLVPAAVNEVPPDAADQGADALGQRLLRYGLISEQDLDKALAFQRQFKGRLGSILVRLGALSEERLLPVLAEQLGYTYVAGDALPPREQVEQAVHLASLPGGWLFDREAIAWQGIDGVIHVASRAPNDAFLQETIATAFDGHALAWHFCSTQEIERVLRGLRVDVAATNDEVAHLRELAEEAPVIELVNNIIAQAIADHASDIHVEPAEREVVIRFRIDGVLHRRLTFPRERFDAIASRIKLISAMDIAERRVPQDGRISMRASGAEMDIRVSAIPAVHGESIVLRLLPKERADLGLDKLGMEPDHREQFARWLGFANGIVLVTGPTGSGKSTTLYTALDQVNNGTTKIVTVEDPVEYKVRGITQIQTHSEIGYGFARALRAILRHDPDVIMIGEIRDLETAEIAVQSALTGHLVFSTLHTNDAAGAFTRLIDMGLEPFLVASSVRAVQAQRLVRRLCAECRRPEKPTDTLLAWAESVRRRFPQAFAAQPDFHAPTGCPKCQATGYRGRVGVYELIEMTPPLQSAVMSRGAAHDLAELALRQGTRTLREDGLVKAWRGVTSLEEVLRVTGAAEGDA
jgi:general secretion pathway protein E